MENQEKRAIINRLLDHLIASNERIIGSLERIDRGISEIKQALNSFNENDKLWYRKTIYFLLLAVLISAGMKVLEVIKIIPIDSLIK